MFKKPSNKIEDGLQTNTIPLDLESQEAYWQPLFTTPSKIVEIANTIWLIALPINSGELEIAIKKAKLTGLRQINKLTIADMRWINMNELIATFNGWLLHAYVPNEAEAAESI